jgi:type IV pilus assembly protein PilO
MNIREARTQKLMLAGIGVAAIVYLYFFSTFVPFGHRPLAEEKGQLEQEYRQLSSDLSKARQTLNNREEVERQYEVITSRWEVAHKLLPEDREVAALLRKVTLVGQQSGVEFELFRPKAQIPGEIYAENPVDVSVTGGYHQVGSFLAEVANLDRIINVGNLNLESLDNGAKNNKTVKATFVATAYTLNPPTEPATDAKSAAGTPAGKPAVTGGPATPPGAVKKPAGKGGSKHEG